MDENLNLDASKGLQENQPVPNEPYIPLPNGADVNVIDGEDRLILDVSVFNYYFCLFSELYKPNIDFIGLILKQDTDRGHDASIRDASGAVQNMPLVVNEPSIQLQQEENANHSVAEYLVIKPDIVRATNQQLMKLF